MRDHIERFTFVVLTLAAVAIAATLVRREFFPRTQVASVAAEAKAPEFLPGWTDLLDGGVFVGDREAPVKVVEFMDLECPYCRKFNASVRALRQKYGSKVAVIVVHYPLDMHRFAHPAARAAECANDHGRFESFFNLVYEKQDSLGLKSWASYASEAGVRDTAAFTRCASATAAVPRIDTGLTLAKKIAADATPTVIVNGWRYFMPPNDAELERVVATLLAGKTPFDSVRRVGRSD